MTSVQSQRTGLVAQKVGMTRLFDGAGDQVPVTVLKVDSCRVVSHMTVNGQAILRWPYASLEDFRARPAYNGIPLLAPWANRLDEQAFYANGGRYPFEMALGNVHGTIPIHGFLSFAREWQVLETGADETAAWVRSRLDFYRHPD